MPRRWTASSIRLDSQTPHLFPNSRCYRIAVRREAPDARPLTRHIRGRGSNPQSSGDLEQSRECSCQLLLLEEYSVTLPYTLYSVKSTGSSKGAHWT